MTILHARSALLAGGWTDDVRLTLADGNVASIETGIGPESGDERVDLLLPAMGNVHSHAFQRAMAGLAEQRGSGPDTFWSWRTLMYRFALTMSPEQVEAVAAQLYMEMLEAGFARVGEFHYLHHDRDGHPYANIAELAERICAASVQTGISLTLLPVFYAHSGFGGAPPTAGQRRFVNSLDTYERLISASRTLVGALAGARFGVAPHSLRAAAPEELAAILPLAGDGPVHIHVAEQVKEVEECLAWSGARPVEWLLDNAPVDDRWCLVHATHMNAEESRRMARSGAVAGLCPVTEANLGDGTFPAAFLADLGAYGIGSDSNILISIPDELRQLEYSERLALGARNVVAVEGGSTGETLFVRATAGGGMALGVTAGIAVGHSADLVSLDTAGAPFLPRDHVLDSWIFAGGVKVENVWARGRRVVESGRHQKREEINARFNRTMAELLATGIP